MVRKAFPTDELADLGSACRRVGEKTGCFTNADRTVHISHKAAEPRAGSVGSGIFWAAAVRLFGPSFRTSSVG